MIRRDLLCKHQRSLDKLGSDDRYLRMKISITDKEWLAENLDKTKEEEDKNVES